MKARNWKIRVGVFCLWLGIVCTCPAETIYVDGGGGGDFERIQDAVNDANDGDTVVVADGTYTGEGNRDINFRGKAITLRSENGPADCIIDCEGSDSEHHLGFHFRGAEGPDSVLDGFTITGGYHEEAGGILCTTVSIHDLRPSNPTIVNCVITNNRGMNAGGIRSDSYCEPLISNCVISDNIGTYTGGVSFADECTVTISNCVVRNNSGSSGGGIRTGGARCHGTISNCLISGNSSSAGAGGVDWWAYGGSVTIINCTIADNTGRGGILIGGGGNPTGLITNCIVWGNRGELGGSQIHVWEITPEVTYCDVEGGWPGEGNIDADPLFVDADGPDNVVGTADDNLRLLGGSPCLNAGSNAAVPPSLTTDLDGNPRIANGTVDMGAYEGPNQGLVVIPQSLVIPEGGTNSFTVALGLDPAGTVLVSVAVESGDPDITVESPAILTFNSSDYSLPQPVTVAAAEDDDYLNSSAAVSVSAPGFAAITVAAAEDEDDHILYVDVDAQGLGTGANWANASQLLQDALEAAREYPTINEIRVARGTYRPDRGHHQSPGSRIHSFEMVNGVALKGGYAGWGEPDPNERDIRRYETILSGDLNGDDARVTDPCDLLTEPTRADNSHHVVIGFDFVDSHHQITAVLDGFTITGGNADGNYHWPPDDWAFGGGFCNRYREGPAITNCTFTANTAGGGGAIYGGNGLVADCIIIHNAAGFSGGGLSGYSGSINNSTINNNFAGYCGGAIDMDERGSPLDNCLISNNTAAEGGAIYNENCEPEISNCTFMDNSADLGGAIYNRVYDTYACPMLRNCSFIRNAATDQGGAMYNDYAFPTLVNCLFVGNSANLGGGVANYQGTELTLANCTFAANSASNGRALACTSYDPQYPYPSYFRLTNCILWDGGDEIWNNDGSTIAVTHTDVRGGWSGAGNIDVDPLFADPDNDDYHLKSQAGRWDVNEGRWTMDDVTSPCIDAGDPISPIGLEPFPNGGIVNMGAYGGTTEASKSYFGGPPCEVIVAGDINGDCEINFLDFQLMALHWCEDNNP
ncbi:MAG: right-handed parallel beta-helix repeat-containing protein [Planctomycetota bacterium]|jgi:GNAT superfamily N-acetyltransferase